MKNLIVCLLLIASALSHAATTEGGAQQVTIRPSGASAGNTGELRLKELSANGANHVGFKAPDAITADKVWTLPAADGTSGQVLQTNGSGVLSFVTATGSVTNVTASSPLASSGGATPNISITSVIGSTFGGTGNAFTKFTGPTTSEKTFTLPNADSTILTSNAAVTVPQGGTGVVSATAGGLVYGNGTSALQVTAAPTSGQIVVGNTTTPSFVTMSGDATITNTGALTVANNAITTAKIADANVTDAKLANMGARSVKGRSANSSGVPADISFASSAGKFLGDRGSALGAFYPTQFLNATANYSITQDNYGSLLEVDTTAGNITVTLPAPATVGAGWFIIIKKTKAGNTVTVARNGSESIDGRTVSDSLNAQYSNAAYMTDGTNWHVMWADDDKSSTVTSPMTFTTSDTFYNVTSLSLTAGTWIVDSRVGFIGSSGAGGDAALEISTFTATGSGSANESYGDKAAFDNVVASRGTSSTLPGVRFVVTASSQTIYLNARMQFGSGTNLGRGYIRAHRIR